MSDIRDLKSIIIMGYLGDDMLKKVHEIAEVSSYKAGEHIFKKGEFAEHLYSIVSGRVAMEIEQNNAKVPVEELEKSMTFGLSCLIDVEEKLWLTDARAIEDTTVFRWNSIDLERLFRQDTALGFVFMKRIAKILKTRLQARDKHFAQ